MIFRLIALGAVAVLGSPALAEKPLPASVKIITADQANSCAFVDVVSDMKFALTSASKSARGALIGAMNKAAKKGANAAVLTSQTAHNNQHQVTLTAYKCEGVSS